MQVKETIIKLKKINLLERLQKLKDWQILQSALLEKRPAQHQRPEPPLRRQLKLMKTKLFP